MADSMTRPEREALPPCIRAMLEPAFYPSRPAAVELVQTHISFVLLAGEDVFKIKKPVKFSFLDFSTLERRRHYCREEVRLNRRLAPDVYLGVLSIRATEAGYRLGEEDDPDAEEYAVHMKRLPAERMFSEILARGEGTGDQIDAIAQRLADFHAVAAASDEIASNGSPEAILAVLESDFSESATYRGITISPEDDEVIQEFCRTFVRTHVDLLRSRQASHRIRECHGDLRAEHICFGDDLVMIDCIEFEPRFRNRDVAAEVAFLAMDIEHLGHRSLAQRLIRRYGEISGDTDLARMVPFYQCYFAYIRGKVESLKSLESEVGADDRQRAIAEARSHFAQAHRYSWAYSPALVAVGGLSGSGKTTVARALHDRFGFEHFNSDVIRKQLAGVAFDRPATEIEKSELYSAERSRQTYAHMLALAGAELESGRGAIVDATFQRREHRRQVDELAANAGVPCVFVECGCGATEIRRRLDRRSRSGKGPSDADWEVYRAQLASYEPVSAGERECTVSVDTSRPTSEIVDRVESAVRRRLGR